MKKKLLTAGSLFVFAASVVPLQASAAVPSSVQMAQVVQTVNFRTGPSSDSAKIRYLKQGEQVEVISKVNAYWLNVRDTNGQIGYVSASDKYIDLLPLVQVKPNAEIVSSVSFRTGPSTNDARIRYLQPGEPVWVVDKPNSYWYKVTDQNGVTGYVSTSTKYITTSYTQPAEEPDGAGDEETQTEADFPAAPNATIVKSVSFRTGPSTNDSRIRYLQAGEQVLIIDKPSSSWYKIIDKSGKIGYVSTNPVYIDSQYKAPYKSINYSEAIERTIEAGMKYLGTPYEFGSSRSDTSTFDCSDFVRQAFHDGIGLLLPGDSRSQGNYVSGIGKTSTDWKTLKRGDLMFFMSYNGYKAEDYAGIDKSAQRITHVGIYLGDGKMLHTYSVSSGGVRIDELAGKSWEYRFLYGGSAF